MTAPPPHPAASPAGDAAVTPALDAALRAFAGDAIDIAVVLGSGLGDFAETVEVHDAVDAAALPDYPVSTIAGHRGRLLVASLHGRRLLLFQGRVHGYEGHPASATALPAAVSAALGARALILTNAAGGLDPRFSAGDLMLVSDLLVLPAAQRMGLDLQSAPGGPPLPRPLLDAALLGSARAAAADARVLLREGVYGYCSGPTYETRAEIAFYRMAGAQAVGMSTAPEVLAATRLGLPALAISCITNIARTVRQTVSHAEVTEVAGQASERLSRLMHALIRRM